MGRPALEVADIFRAHGPAWRQAQLGHLSLGQLKVMSAIEQCRSVCIDTRLSIPAATAASWMARLSWRGVTGSSGDRKSVV